MLTIILVVLGVLTLTGTFMGSEGGFIPFKTVKKGVSVGINFGLMTEFENGAVHYGINLGLFNRNWHGKVVGLDLSLWSFGTETPQKKVVGLQFSLVTESILKGVQIGIFNNSDRGKSERNSVLVNFDFRPLKKSNSC